MRRRTRSAGLAGLLAVGLLVGFGGSPPVSAVQEPEPRRKVAAKSGGALPEGVVTLLTGDRVTVGPGDRVEVKAGPGRKVGFERQRIRGRLYVIPSDVAADVTSGKLDRALFEVAGLIEHGLDDRRSKEIPLLVTTGGKARQQFAAAKVTRELPVIGGVALKVRKGAGFLGQVRTAGVQKVWLDARMKPVLDQSVPQVGAPAAWQAGFTGAGVPVAVVDSGIDPEHPDVRVTGARNFTDEPDGDKVGHGTHVASTIAGAGGKYQGVAPGASLYDAKVCTVQSCYLSAIVAGMEWAAAEVKAKVVNVSLGGADGPEVDPVEEAVDRLTKETGTLFVVSAGNEGEAGRGTTGSPANVPAALTVGAVDKQDELAVFSSRGPAPDGTVKPDLTAPGVGIVAARAKGTDIGTPVGEHHTSLNGTSMAAPHVAGAAAILAQQHPDWKAARLKAQLVSAAIPIAGQTGYEQGSGRLDVAQAVANKVYAETGSLWFGKARYPHDDDKPVTKTVTYRNEGAEPVELSFSANLLGPDSKPAPGNAVELGAPALTVPAGGTAELPVTLNTNHAGPDGDYSGQVVAKAGDRTVSTAIAIHKEVESYDLTVDHIAPDGKPVPDAVTTLYFKELWPIDLTDPSGTAKIRLPKDEYMLQNEQEASGASYHLVQPILKLTADTTVEMDARLAKPLELTARPADAALVTGAVGLRMPEPWTFWIEDNFTDPAGRYFAHIGPAADGPVGFISSRWARRDADGTFDNSPYLLNQLDKTPGRYPTGIERVVDPAELIQVDQVFHASSDRRAEVVSGDGWGFAALIEYDLPAKRRSYHEPTDDADGGTNTSLTEFADGPEGREYKADVYHTARHYRSGQRYRERFNAAVFGPGRRRAIRWGTGMAIQVQPLADVDGEGGGSSFGSAADSRSSKLFRDGVLIEDYDDRFGFANPLDLDPAPATYKLVSTLDRHSVSKFSTKVEHAWTFRSDGSEPGERPLPLLVVKYRPVVDAGNITPRMPVTRLPVEIAPQQDGPLPTIGQVSVEYQAGPEWRPAKLVRKSPGKYVAEFPTPAGDAVSLRAKVIDGDGNTTEQTVTDAIRLS